MLIAFQERKKQTEELSWEQGELNDIILFGHDWDEQLVCYGSLGPVITYYFKMLFSNAFLLFQYNVLEILQTTLKSGISINEIIKITKNDLANESSRPLPLCDIPCDITPLLWYPTSPYLICKLPCTFPSLSLFLPVSSLFACNKGNINHCPPGTQNISFYSASPER